MATLLYRIGRFSYRRHWTVIGVWLLLAAGILGGSFALGGQTQESFAIPGMQGIIAGGSPGPVIAAALVLLGLAIGSVLVSLLAIRRTRRVQALGLTAMAPA